MMRSMSLAIAALRNHQVFMDVVSSNISNVNTTGFKGSRIGFQELLNQTVRGSSAPRGGAGGLNPIQIGLGMALAGIDTMFTQGSLQDTGKLTDIAIQGDGFFVLQDPEGGYVYSRDGHLDMGVNGKLLHLATGYNIMGWTETNAATGEIDTDLPVQEIEIPYGKSLAQATSEMTLLGNLDAQAATGDTSNATITMYDSLGISHDMTLTFAKQGTANQWSWTASHTDADISALTGTGTFNFDPTGQYLDTNPVNTLSLTFSNGADPAAIDMDYSAFTQLDGLSNVSVSDQNGLPPGELTTFNMTTTGEIIGVFSNGLNDKIGRIAMADFINPGGLVKLGQSLFGTSANSGTAQVGVPGQDGRGQVSGGYLEMSNVELAQQFTDMIVAQRGFQANSRVITSSDEMLQELVNLKR
jgi:flagellar hook protein FlgE